MKTNKFTAQALSVLIAFAFFLLSCAKGDGIDEPLYGLVYFNNFAVGSIDSIQNNGKKISLSAVGALSCIPGNNRFKFYEADRLLLDTLLMVESLYKHNYFMFRPSINAPLRIYDHKLNGFDTEKVIDPETIKFSMANFSEVFPAKVNVYVTTQMIINSRAEQVQVGEFLNVSSSFSEYHKIAIGRSIDNVVVARFNFTVKDPDTKAVLSETSILLPKIPQINVDQLAGSVYLLYLNGTAAPTVLMSKL